MSTRGLIGFRHNGADRLAYNHFDSDPQCLGARILEEVRKVDAWDIARERVNSLMTIDEARKLSEHDGIAITEIRRHYPDVSYSKSPRDYYELYKPLQGTLHPYLSGRLTFIPQANDFICDSLHCEWAYVVNLDASAFEVWKGGQLTLTEEASKRYDPEPNRMGYYPCALVRSYGFDSLPSGNDFLRDWKLR